MRSPADHADTNLCAADLGAQGNVFVIECSSMNWRRARRGAAAFRLRHLSDPRAATPWSPSRAANWKPRQQAGIGDGIASRYKNTGAIAL